MRNGNHINSSEGISLKEYVNDKFANLEKAIDVRFNSVTQATNTALTSADKAISKADASFEKRLDSVNEFRSTLSDQASKFIIRTEFELVVTRLEQDIKNLAAARTELMSASTYNAAHKDLQTQVDELKSSKALIEGRGQVFTTIVSTGISVGIGLLFLLLNYLLRQ